MNQTMKQATPHVSYNNNRIFTHFS